MKLYGIAEIADACGVSQGLASKWYQRGRLPKPSAVLRATPVWYGAAIERWLDEQHLAQARRARAEVAAAID